MKKNAQSIAYVKNRIRKFVYIAFAVSLILYTLSSWRLENAAINAKDKSFGEITYTYNFTLFITFT